MILMRSMSARNRVWDFRYISVSDLSRSTELRYLHFYTPPIWGENRYCNCGEMRMAPVRGSPPGNSMWKGVYRITVWH